MRLSKRIVLVVVALVVIVGVVFRYLFNTPALEPPRLEGTFQSHGLDVDGLRRTFHYYVPGEPSPAAAVIIALHSSRGDGLRMRQAITYDLDELADRHGFIVVYPDGYKNHWNDCRKAAAYDAKQLKIDDVQFIRTLVSFLQTDYPVDPERIFAVGLSNGGGMSFRLALEAPDLVRGVAAIAANMPAQDNLDCRPAGKAVAVMIVNGTLDSINPYDGGEVTLLGPWGTRGVVKSSGASAGYWAGQAGYSTEPFIIRYPDVVAEDKSVAMHSVWSDQLRPEIGLITVHGGGHTIPHPTAEFPRLLGPVNRDFNAIDEIWQFFQREMGRAPGPPVALD